MTPKVASTRKARLANNSVNSDDDSSNLEELVQSYVMNALAKDISKAYKPSSGQKRDGKYWIEKPVFMLIKETFGPDGLKQFLDARRLAIAREKGNWTNKVKKQL